MPTSNDFNGNAGFDFKYGLTRGLIADVTVRTDFAQVEEDVQQVNLTRFSLFFPEKRDFFLEGQGIFAFGGIGSGNGGSPGDVPVMFFSRQIGLNKGQEVPVLGGGRVTGRAGRYSIGALNIETGDKPSAGALATNFSTVRIKRDVLRRSNIGMIATHRSEGINGGGANTLLGADANFFLLTNLTANLFYARTQTAGPDRRRRQLPRHLRVHRRSIRFQRRAPADRSTLRSAGRDTCGASTSAAASPRRDSRRGPKRRNRVRKYTYLASMDYVTDADATVVQNKQLRGHVPDRLPEQRSVLARVHSSDYELIPRPFTISPGVVVPAGGYDYRNRAHRPIRSASSDPISGRRRCRSRHALRRRRAPKQATAGASAIVPQFAVEPSISLNWVDLPYGTFSAQLLNSRFIFTPSPRMIISSLVQYNMSARSITSSVRLRWEYRPGSELFVVYSDGHNLLESQTPTGLLNRSIALKITRLLRL